MTQPLALSGITGFVNDADQATPAQRQGDVADPRHANIGEVASPYPWEVFAGESHGPYGLENGLLGMDICSYSDSGGQVYQDPTMDQTPITHAAPWPKGIDQSMSPDSVSAKRQESADIHASNLGGSREALYEPTLNPVQDDWVELLETDPGITFPAMVPIPGQIMTGGSGGWGSRDRVQSMAGQNQYGYDSAHMHRRYAAGSIPGNFLWMQAGGRPLIKSIPGTAKVPVGPTSPFYGQIPGDAFDSQGAALAVLPSQYVAPPDPALASSFPGGEAPSVDLW